METIRDLFWSGTALDIVEAVLLAGVITYVWIKGYNKE